LAKKLAILHQSAVPPPANIVPNGISISFRFVNDNLQSRVNHRDNILPKTYTGPKYFQNLIPVWNNIVRNP
jgi:hypothetical protein